MLKYPLSDKQKEMLRDIVPALKEERLSPELGFLRITNRTKDGRPSRVSFDGYRIIEAVESNFKTREAMAAMRKLHLRSKAEEAAKYLLHAWDNDVIGSYLELVDATAGSDKTIQAIPVLGVIKPDEFIAPAIEILIELAESRLIEIKDGASKSGNRKWMVQLTSTLREAVENDFYIPLSGVISPVDQSTNINIHDSNFSGNTSIASTFTHSFQTLEQTQHLDSDMKQELTGLITQLKEALENVPEEHVEDAEDIAVLADRLVQDISSKRVSKRRVRDSLNTLRERIHDVSAVGTVAPMIPEIVRIVTEFLNNLP